MNNVRIWSETLALKKVGLWFLVSLVLSVVFFRDFWTSLPAMLSPDWVLGQQHASPWGVFALCAIFIWFKRKALWKRMDQESGFAAIPLGLALIAGAIFIPSAQDYQVFRVLLAGLGVFVAFFGKAAVMPAILLAVYGFAISFPLVIQQFAEEAYARLDIAPLTWLMTALGYPLEATGQLLRFTTSSGEPIAVTVTVACAGPATMGVFIALFALMMLDIPLSPKKALWFFLFGAAGTWFQNFIRLVLLILIGYYLGGNALRIAHFWTIYILFPLWYLLFAYLYFRQTRRSLDVRGKRPPEYLAVSEK